MEKKELPEEIQIKKVQKVDSEIKYISFGEIKMQEIAKPYQKTIE